MSPLWANELSVFVSTQWLEIRYQQAFTGKTIFSQTVTLQNTQEAGWENALAALKAKLQTLTLKKNATFKVYLGADLVRLLCIPAQNIAMTREDERAFVSAMFQKVYVCDTADWEIYWDSGAFNQTIVAYALDKKILDSLKALAAFFKLRLTLVSPLVAAVFNRYTAAISHQQYLFCVLEPNRIVLIDVKNQDVHKVKTHKLAPEQDLEVALIQILEREAMLYEGQKDLLIVNPLLKRQDQSTLAGWRLMKPHKVNLQAAELMLSLV